VRQYVADQAPAARLAPPAGTRERALLQQWLNYLATEIHKEVYFLIFNPAAPADAKQFARAAVPAKYAYLVTTLGWAQPAGIDLSAWPVLIQDAARLRERPAVARALGEELALAGRG